SLTLADNASLDHRLRLTCPSIRAGERAIAPASQGSASPLRIGFAVRKAGDHESQAFRIPGIATTPKGALIAVYDVRRRGWTDLPNDIDIGMSRSTDGGRTWEPMRIVMDMGNDPQFRYDGIGDPSVLVDTTSGTIFVAATWSHGERSWHGSGPGMTPEETGQLMLVKSTDDGLTWSAPINVTSQVKKPEWSFVLPGPGRGITMADGTLVYPAQFRDSPEAKGLPHSTIMVSRDHGKTWQIGTPAFDDTTECAVVESSPGVLMLNCRNNRQPRRVVMTTRDLGRTWTEHSTSRKSLPEPRACMGSLASVAFDGRTWLLFSNPNAETPPRRAMTIKASDNAGETWPEHWHLLIDEGLSAGYSCLTQVDALHAGLLFESSRANIAFVRVPLSELTHVPAPFRAAELQRRIGELQLATPFTDHMVIQRDVEIPVWGTGPPEERIVVRLGDKEVRGKIEATGDWTVRLPAVPVSRDPLKLSVTASGRTVQVSDVLVGDVWLASGQSNMAWPLKSTTDDERLLIDSTDDQLRLFNFQPSVSGLPGSYDLEQRKRLHAGQFFAGTWQRSSPEANADFSAVAFHFAKALRRDRDVPVGIMCCAFGGSPTEAWIRSAALGTDRDLKSFVAGNWLENDHVARWCQERGRANFAVAMSRGDYLISDACGPNHPYKPSFLWETGIQRLVPFPVQGVLWYQGESNAEAAADVEWHRRLFTLLIADWRALWNDPQLPFLFVQLPAIDRPHWPEFRETQRQVASSTARTAMAVTIDTGDRNNVHPKAKRVVGERLAALAAAMIDHSQNAELAKGPVFQKVEVDGHRLRLSFEHTGSSLKTTDVQAPRHFEVAAEDGVFHAANAAIDGQTILLSAPAVAHPTQARYAWTSFPDPAVNFVNSGGYPASPFAISSLSKAGPSAVVPAKVSQ
ncbi:MAG TPA: exo-alpha-sialidase, partial [Caulifigura sp.]|nr:exo-alpha-sialidase [Caulifigura sp.]